MEIIASNALLLRAHGLGFLKGEKIAWELDDFGIGTIPVRIAAREPLVRLESCAPAEAVFNIAILPGNFAIGYEKSFVLESGPVGTNSTRIRIGKVRRERLPRSFNLSYIYNVASDKWTFSQPELLFELGLTDDVQKCHKLDWRSLIHHEDLPLYENTFHNALRHGGNHEMHYRIVRGDGGSYQVSDYCGLAAPENQWPCLVGSVVCSEQSDETRFHAERQVLTGRLLGGMIHDFKNLLGGIRNIIEWAINISDKSDVSDALRKTLGYTDQATDLIISTLRLNSSVMDTRIEKINIGEMVMSLEGLITRIIPASTLLEIEASPELPYIYGQKCLIQDMFINLCVNARDAMKNKGDTLRVVIAPESLEDEHGRMQNYVMLSVSDNGCGMSKAEVRKIFDAFYSTKEHGAGLGMWMVKNAVSSFDGRIEVSSEVGCGTTFKVLFPIVEPDADFIEPQAQAAQEDPVDANFSEVFAKDANRTILYIEDNLLVSSSVRMWLESLGFNLLFAADGISGKRLFQEHADHIDLVIQDFVLPGIKGDELLTFFSGSRPDIPVIVVSAENDEDCARRLMERGARDMIRKPFKMEDLLGSIANILNHDQ